MNNIGQKLFSLRNVNGRKVSAKLVADKLGKTVQAIYGYEKGTIIPDILVLKKFAEFYNVPLIEIVGSDEYEGIRVSDIAQKPIEKEEDKPSQEVTHISTQMYEELKKELDYFKEKLDEANSTIKQLVSIMANGVGKLEGNTVPSYYVHNLAQSALIVG
ncbi:MAG: hypothetical protein RLZZ175_2798 [Bacteroidota bacterium]|jgi:transcriptional regulator with XRE-family HTH domain